MQSILTDSFLHIYLCHVYLFIFDHFFFQEQVPVYSVQASRNAAKTFELKTGPPYIYRATSQTDTRFIPNRKGQNFDASRYNLLNKAKPIAREIGSSEYLDIINQVS